MNLAMKKYIPEDYPDLLDKIVLTTKDVFAIVEPFELVFPQTRNQAVEWGIKFPMFVDAFYDYVIRYKSIPIQQSFFAHYLLFNKTFFDDNKFQPEIVEGLKARIYRTYPSLIRDLYFNKYVKENLSDSSVIYNTILDVKEGIDLMIEKNNSFYAVNLFTDTKRAYHARKIKRQRHTPFENVRYLEFPVNFNDSLKCGNFFLYGSNVFLQLKKLVE